jgi:hypothetical protein
MKTEWTRKYVPTGRGLMAVTEMKIDSDHKQRETDDGVFIFHMGTTMSHREKHESLTFMPVSTA